MELNLLLVGRIILMIIAVFFIVTIISFKIKKRTGNPFFVTMMVFWSGVFLIGLKPSLIDSILNTTGLVNRSQFLLVASIVIIVYLLYLQISKNQMMTYNIFKVTRKIALSNLNKEFSKIKNQNTDVLVIITAYNESKNIGNVIDGWPALEHCPSQD